MLIITQYNSCWSVISVRPECSLQFQGTSNLGSKHYDGGYNGGFEVEKMNVEENSESVEKADCDLRSLCPIVQVCHDHMEP